MRACSIAVLVSAFLATASVASPPAYTDADVLGLEVSGSLVAPGSTVLQISQDLDAIRAAYPALWDGVAGIHVFPTWYPGVILVQLTPEAWTDYENGVFEEFNNLNAQYGPVTISSVAPRWLMLEFTSLYHASILASTYAQVVGIEQAKPNNIAGDGDDITSSQVGTYTFKRGWGDCPAGCMYQHFWEFEVTNGIVTLLDEYGDSTLSGVGKTPSGANVFLMGNAPNPFGTTTDVSFQVTHPTRVQLRVYNAAGQLIRNLHDAHAPAGVHTTSWDGTDNAGREVASGVYFCNLVADGATQSRKMLVIR
jgi:hypothetical protein